VLRYKEPNRVRPFRIPGGIIGVWVVAIGGAALCILTAAGLPAKAWERFGLWMALGLALYFVYGFRNSHLRRGTSTPPTQP